MRKGILLVAVLFVLFLVSPSAARSSYPADEVLKVEVEQALGAILDLWRNGRYGEVYDRTIPASGDSLETFADRLAAARYRPACCWQKMQDVKVMESGSGVMVRAKFGLEGGQASTDYSTRTVKLVRNGNDWLVSSSDLMKLAVAAKKKKRSTKKRNSSNDHRSF